MEMEKEYEIFSEKFYEGEFLNEQRNGYGKEYDEYGNLFEGEYLYGFRLRGKEYIKGILSYEGDYLYDRKWNGKGYDKNGNIIYELINGAGNVKEFIKNWTLIYEGEYLNGKRNGKGKEYENLNGVLIYEGEYLNGERHGKGKEYSFNDGSFWGEVKYLNGIRHKKCIIF